MIGSRKDENLHVERTDDRATSLVYMSTGETLLHKRRRIPHSNPTPAFDAGNMEGVD